MMIWENGALCFIMNNNLENQHPLKLKISASGLTITQFSSTNKGVNFTISVLAKPGHKHEKVAPDGEGNLVIYTKARPIDGQANDSIVQMVADYFKIGKSFVEIAKGGKSRQKRVIVTIIFTDNKNLAYYLK